MRARISLAMMRLPAQVPSAPQEPGRPRVFVALAADYGNLGDLAITHAQTSFLAEQHPGAVIEPIPISATLSAIKRLRREIRADDVITLIGGGNTGDMYDDIQFLRELFIRHFPRNRMVSFPQTIEFSDSVYGRWAERRARRIYNAHPNLTIMARDSRSHESASVLFSQCRVVLAPDVVLTLDESAPAEPREGMLVALRADLERGLSPRDHDRVVAAARDLGPVQQRDTHVGDVRLPSSAALGELEDFWKACRSSRVVVTDRLHGMIFAVITGTPCLALDSGTGKVAQFYRDWLTDVSGVRLLDGVVDSELRRALAELDEIDLLEWPSHLGERFAMAFEHGLAGPGRP